MDMKVSLRTASDTREQGKLTGRSDGREDVVKIYH